MFESCLHFRYCPCFEKGAPWDSGNYRVWNHSKKWVHGMITKYSRTFSSVVHGKSWNPTEDSSDDLWFSKYHAFEYKIDLQAFPCTSRSFKLRLKGLLPVLTADCWLCPYWKHVYLNPSNYTYQLNDDGLLSPIVISGEQLPEDFPVLCPCYKCARSSIYACRRNNFLCCDFYRYKTEFCNNPNNA